MPTFQGQVSEENLMALVAYIKSLSQPKGSASDQRLLRDVEHAVKVHAGSGRVGCSKDLEPEEVTWLPLYRPSSARTT